MLRLCVRSQWPDYFTISFRLLSATTRTLRLAGLAGRSCSSPVKGFFTLYLYGMHVEAQAVADERAELDSEVAEPPLLAVTTNC